MIFEQLDNFRLLSENDNLVLKSETPVVEIGRADGKSRFIRKNHLRMEIIGRILHNVGSFFVEIAQVASAQNVNQRHVGVERHDDINLHAPVQRRFERFAQDVAGQEIGRLDGDGFRSIFNKFYVTLSDA